MNDYKIQLGALLDANAKGDLQKQAEAIKDLAVTVSKLNLDQSAITELKNQLTKNGIDINLVFGNTNQLQNQAKQIGKTVGQLISDNADKAISNVSSKSMGKYFKIDPSTSNEFKREMEGLVSNWTEAKGQLTDIKIDTRTSFDKDAGKNITRLHQATVSYKNELNEVIKKTIAWRQIGTNKNANGEEEALRGFVEVAGQYSKSLDTATIKTDNFISQQKRLVGQLSNSLDSIQSGYKDQNSSKPIKSQANIDSLSKQYEVVKASINSVGAASKSNFADMEVEAKKQISILQSMVKEYRNAENVSSKLKGTDFNSGLSIANNDLEKLKADAKDFPQITKTVNDLDVALSKVGDTASLNTFNDQLRVARSELSKVKAETVAINKDEKVGINVSGLEAKIADIQRISPEINKFKTQINGAEVSVESLLSDLSKVKTQGDFSVVNSRFKSFSDSAKSAGISVSEVTLKTNKLATDSQRLSKTNSIKTWADNNSKAMKLLGADVNRVLDGLKKPNLPTSEYDKLNAEFEKIKINAREMNLLGKTPWDSVKDMGSKFFSWVSVSGLIMTGLNSLRKMREEVINLDNSLLELSKVSDLSAKGLAEITDKAYKLGETVGKTGTQVIDAITEFKRAGYELSDSMDMAEAALMMTNVAEGITETTDAAGTLISVLKGYDMAESQTMSIVDMLNSTSNQSPIGFDELAEGLERTAGTMAQSGTTIQETIGLLTAGYAQLRNVEKVSTSLITLSARLRGVNEDGESIDGLSAELQKSFGKIGIAIEDADGNLRSIYQIAQDYSKVLPTLTDKQKQYYAELAAGKRNVTTWNAITQQFSDAEKATEQAINSVGSATKENEKYLDSISGKISQNVSAFQSLSNTIIDSELVKFFVDLGTTGVKGLDSLASAIKYINSLGGNISSIGGTLGALSGLLMNKTGMGKLYRAPLYIGLQYLAM
ncbi:phage tail tape measure protein [Lacrimispora amygdalina]|uniref:Phage tail tape measure protein n=1 Tax=Lacrimispora amygdalina TaxID=253257 RepID=A0A3E2NB14_9FIRM|nr:phage tail tape measure protein [Clostridium indicum]RFZ78209.1 phage tail tape measure protein [Clostridium indicum]